MNMGDFIKDEGARERTRETFHSALFLSTFLGSLGLQFIRSSVLDTQA